MNRYDNNHQLKSISEMNDSTYTPRATDEDIVY